jgi:NhaP-type Na+/H+ or K+/H+ antiporter
MGSIKILLEFEAPMTSNELTLSMVYFGIIVSLLVSMLSILYIKYHFKDMKLSSRAVHDYH